MTQYSLAHLTVLDLAPPEMISLAAKTGFQSVGLRLIAVTPTTPCYDLMTDKPLMRMTRQRIADTDVSVLDIEFVKITPQIDIKSYCSFLEAGAELNAKHVVVAPYDPDLSRMADHIAEFCDLAAPFGLTINLEFFPWADVPDLATAIAVISQVEQANCGILLDVLHFDRSGSTLQHLRDVPAEWLNFVHLCDARGPKPTTNDGLIFTAREDRLPPGDGAIDLVSILRDLPANIAIGLEVPMAGRSVATYEDIARRCRIGAERVVAAAKAH